MNLTIEEAKGFAAACEEYSHGAIESFHRDAFHKASEVINNLCGKLSTIGVINMTKEEERETGKRDIPPTPPIERKGVEKEEPPPPPPRACARTRGEIFPPTLEMVREYCRQEQIDELYADFFVERMTSDPNTSWRHPGTLRRMNNWKRCLYVWWKCEGDFGGNSDWAEFRKAHTPQASKPSKVYEPKDWDLCREVCGCCGEKGCKSGVKVPPNMDPDYPRRPETCPKFKAL